MKKLIGLAAALLVAALLLTALHWSFRGEALLFETAPVAGDSSMAAILDEAAEQIVREDGLDRDREGSAPLANLASA
jgi:hypothetical protein